MHLGLFNKKKLIYYVLSTYKNTLYEIIFEHGDKLARMIFELDDKSFYDIIIHLNRKSYVGYYSLHVSNNLKQALLEDDYERVEEIVHNPSIDEVLDNPKLSTEFKMYFKHILNFEKIAYNMLLEKCTLCPHLKINNIELNRCKHELDVDIEGKHFDKHKTTVAIMKRGEDILYDVNDLIYRCFKNMNDYDNDRFSSSVYDFIKTEYIDEICIIENYLLNKN